MGLRKKGTIIASYGQERMLKGQALWYPVALSLPALALLASLGAQLQERYPQLWFCSLVVVFALYLGIWTFKRQPFHRALAVFTAGLAIAGGAAYFQAPSLRFFYVPYAAVAGGLLGLTELAGALAATGALLGMDYYLGGQGTEEAVLFAVAALTGALADWIGSHAEMRGRNAAAPAAPTGEPTALDGLRDEEDPELRDILKAVALALEPECVVLFLHSDGELSFRASTMRDIEPAPQGLAYDAVRYRHSVVSADLESVHDNPGYTREGRMASAVASPVMDGTYIAGVLVADSTRTDAFTKEDVAVLEVFAKQVAHVLSERRVLGEAEKHIEWLSLLNKETTRLTTSLETEAIVRQVAQTMQEIAPSDVYVFLRQKTARGYTLAHQSGGTAPRQRSNLLMEGTVAGMALEERAPKYFSHLRDYPVPLMPMELSGVESALMVPLLYHGEPMGVAVMVSGQPESFGPRHAGLLGVLGNQAAAALQNAGLHAEIKERALTDGLTGLINHRHFMERLAAELKRFDRTGGPVSFMLVDADHFKRVNDTYGHPAGDQVLRDLSDLIRSALRAHDIPARYGGEEFAAALPGTAPRDAMQIAERLRRSVEDFRFSYQDTHIPVTISIGIAACPFDDTTMPGLIKKADDALYRAKKDGRNRVVAWGDIKSA